jgi:hypothetical protein
VGRGFDCAVLGDVRRRSGGDRRTGGATPVA